jgi:hypothetical protein
MLVSHTAEIDVLPPKFAFHLPPRKSIWRRLQHKKPLKDLQISTLMILRAIESRRANSRGARSSVHKKRRSYNGQQLALQRLRRRDLPKMMRVT